MNIKDVYRSGFVQRYHSNPEIAWAGQTNGQHQWGVAILLLALFDARANMALLWEALHHDAGEMGTADMSAPNKRRHPAAAESLALAERNERIEMGAPEAWLTVEEWAILKLCDGLEAWLFARVRCPWMLTGDGWPEMRLDLIERAKTLGVEARVEELLA